MGTNYYLTNNGKPHCQSCTCFERIHIGKSSAGWCFSLHAVPDLTLNSLDDWRRKLEEPGTVITTEYGGRVSVEEMLDIIANRSSGDDERLNSGTVPFGYSSWDAFHDDNDSEPGPRGLLRHKVGRHCIGHGEGTWDLVPGEFS